MVTNEDYKAKVYAANIKSGNNNYLSHSTWTKMKPLADLWLTSLKLVTLIKVSGQSIQGCIRLQQYLGGVKPGGAWTR